MSDEKRVKDFLRIKQDLVVLDFFSENQLPPREEVQHITL
jgi:hypothetical protein